MADVGKSPVPAGGRPFLRSLLALAVPVTLQNLTMAAFNAVDTLMIGQLSAEAVGAVGVANRVAFVLQVTLFGLASGGGIFVAQYWGKGDRKRVREISGTVLLLAVALAAGVSVGVSLFPRQILGLFSPDPQVVALGAVYLRILAAGFPFLAVSLALNILLRNIGEVRLPLVINFVFLLLNGLLDYALIFGRFGLPAWGVPGAAMATAGTRIAGSLLFIFLVYRRSSPAAGRLGGLWALPGNLRRRMAAKTAPILLQEVFWSAGITAYFALFGWMGSSALAAYQITATLTDLCFIGFIGLASAGAVLTGNSLGAGRPEEAFDRARRIFRITLLSSLGLGALIALGAGPVSRIYQVEAAVQEHTRQMLLVFSGALLFRALNMVLLIGLFRSGGDTRIGLILDLGGVWGIGIPLGLAAAFLLQAPPPLVFLALNGEEAVKTLIILPRFFSRRWMHDLTRGDAL